MEKLEIIKNRRYIKKFLKDYDIMWIKNIENLAGNQCIINILKQIKKGKYPVSFLYILESEDLIDGNYYNPLNVIMNVKERLFNNKEGLFNDIGDSAINDIDVLYKYKDELTNSIFDYYLYEMTADNIRNHKGYMRRMINNVNYIVKQITKDNFNKLQLINSGILREKTIINMPCDKMKALLDIAIYEGTSNIGNALALTKEEFSDIVENISISDFEKLVNFLDEKSDLSELRTEWIPALVRDDFTINDNLLKFLYLANTDAMTDFLNNMPKYYLENNETTKTLQEVHDSYTSVLDKENYENYLAKLGEIVESVHGEYLIYDNDTHTTMDQATLNYLLKLPKKCSKTDIINTSMIAETLVTLNQYNENLSLLINYGKENLLDYIVTNFLDDDNVNILEEKNKTILKLSHQLLQEDIDLETCTRFFDFLTDEFDKLDEKEKINQLKVRSNYFKNHSITDTFNKLDEHGNNFNLRHLIYDCTDKKQMKQNMRLATIPNMSDDLLNVGILKLQETKNPAEAKEIVKFIKKINSIDLDNSTRCRLLNNYQNSTKTIEKPVQKIKKAN